jgi:glycosyltransferase involved in cell wall biosynthesis
VIALSAYALSGGYREQLEAVTGETPAYVTLPELRRMAPSGIVRALRRGRGQRCLLAIEDPSSMGVLPVLELLGAVVGAARIEVVHPDLRLERVSRARATGTLPPLAAASVGGRFAVRRARRELAELRDAPRIETAIATTPERILYVNPNLWFGLKAGGSVGHVAGVVNGLSRRGIGVTLASASEPVLVDDAVSFVPIDAPTPFALPFAVNGLRLQHRLLDSLAQVAGTADAVYQRHAVSSYIGVQLSRSRHVPLVLEYNGSEVWAAEHWGGRGLRYADVARAAEDVSLQHAHLVVTISDVLADELRDRGLPDDRIVCYPNCVDPALFDPDVLAAPGAAVRRRLDFARDELVVGFVGTFGAWHGAERFAEAIARLHRDEHRWLDERHVRFVFVGDGIKMTDVRNALAGVDSGVTFTGLVPQSESPALLAACDVLVSPHVPNPDGSRFFGSPTKLFEYMAMSKGIVASDLDQIGETLRGSLRASALPNGPPPAGTDAPAVLCEPGSVEELIAGIRFLCDSPEWRTALGANARARVLSRYTWEHHVDAILAGLRRVGD